METSPAQFGATLLSEDIRLLQRQAALPDHYLADLQDHVAPLAAGIQALRQTADRPILVGLNGSQGSGKSTLARFLSGMLHIGAGLRCTVVSIDDFYLTKSARQRLAREVHPLLVTRGVPGTHDLPLANTTLDLLLDPSRTKNATAPVFNKAVDDRERPNAWSTVAPGVDIVILEGWCVGCPPETAAAIGTPVNALECEEDADMVWRRFINDALTNDYQQLFQRLDLLVMLAAPSFDCVFEWREQQERQLAQSIANRENTDQPTSLLFGPSLLRFIQHFERLTRHQLTVLPPLADAVIELAANHRMVAHSGPVFV